MEAGINGGASHADRVDQAIETIRNNDCGGFTVPTRRLYPHQWNWDSAFTALGWRHFDRPRAWREIITLLEAQWEGGMVPHIVFRSDDPDYFPGPCVWRTDTHPPSSGHSQPPVLSSVVLRLASDGAAGDEDMETARAMFDALVRYHRWFMTARDPDATGVIAITHPWESGRDNAPDWDAGLDGVSVPRDLMSYKRRDTAHVDKSQRPTTAQYDRYLAIVQFGREAGWDHGAIHERGPFLVADPGVQFVLMRANSDLGALARLLGREDALGEIDDWRDRLRGGADWLWNCDVGSYCARDIRTGTFSDAVTNASMLCFYAGTDDDEKRASMAAHCRRIVDGSKFAMPSLDPAHPGFDAKRYWRGPVWAMMNHMIAIGLEESAEKGMADAAARIRRDTVTMIERSGFAEYFNPLDGGGLGGGDFSWTAAIYLEMRGAVDAVRGDGTQ